MSIFQSKQSQNARELLRQARHLRNLRGDIMRDVEMKKLLESEEALESSLRAGDAKVIDNAIDRLYTCMGKIVPGRRQSVFAENFEILVVAVVVAMGFRTYLIQPFKIPTGSMEPTLNGIHVDASIEPRIMDRIPMRYLKWLIYGERYIQVKIKEDGFIGPRELSSDEITAFYTITKERYKVTPGCRKYKLPKNAVPFFSYGNAVRKGDILWSGFETTGDHVFVDKIRWNFQKPKRGQVVVFSTKNIPTLPYGTHYIKRLIGIPGENIRIVPPNILINGRVIDDIAPIVRIERQESPYSAGYVLAQKNSPNDIVYIDSTNSIVELTLTQYFALGDNTTNSRDGRYWGPIPGENTIGPAFLVYWPWSTRWGLIH